MEKACGGHQTLMMGITLIQDQRGPTNTCPTSQYHPTIIVYPTRLSRLIITLYKGRPMLTSL
ncbi:hypothetical protein E2C01_033263 [Portunus trituberculatus]|uniref:Uncharacterized protein n=1 Tax=Portunus trituberculatus TaxID=210409 RepID=A0A5B7F2Z5_PORTR|nr:hypothetical protein [Portunus trituberculatus]